MRPRMRLLSLAIIVLVVESASIVGDTPRIITEGVGWDRFTVVANANFLMDVLGAPDQHSNGRMMKWTKAGLNCLLNDKNDAIDLRFEKRFKGVTGGGVTFGMPVAQVRKI